VHRREVGGLAAGAAQRGPAHAACVVTAARSFDLDHVGAEVTEHLRGSRAGEDAREVQDPKAVQRDGFHAESSSLRRRVTAWAV
jgi:hypothetical protein